MSRLHLVVRAIDDGIPGVRTLTLAASDGAPLPSFTPGSHIVVECGARANAYSLTGESVAPTEYTISVLECVDGSGGSRWIHHELAVGDSVVARPPRSAFAPILKARKHLMIGAGIGITPLVSHLRSARRWDRDVELLYVHREGRGAYVDEIKALTDYVRVFTDRAAFIAELEPVLADQPFGTHVYICGPSDFIDTVTGQAAGLGWPPSRIHVERFGIDALDPGDPFEVTVTGGGEPLLVNSGVSLLEALETNGYRVPNMCRQGVCGECRITVAAGDISHRDLYLTDDDKAAGDTMMSCVSRAYGDHLEVTL